MNFTIPSIIQLITDFNLSDTALIYGAIILVFVLALWSVFSFIFKKKKDKGFLSRGMNLVLFLVTLPRRVKEEGGKEVTLHEHFKTAEQFYSSLAGIKEPNFFKRWFLGNPAFVFEIAVHRAGEEICFYVACPRSVSGIVEKEILAFWPKSQIQAIPDYNIFNPSGVGAASEMDLSRSVLLPLKNYKDFGIDPLSAITSVFTKLAREGEGAAIQILVRSSKASLKSMAEKVIQSMQSGAKLEKAISGVKSKAGVSGLLADIASTFMQKSQAQTQEATGSTSPSSPNILAQNTIAAISEKASQHLFDVNIRMITSAPTEAKAQSILEQLQSAFEQLGSPALNQFKFQKIKGSNLKKLFYQFIFRIFSEKKIILLSSAELAGVFHFPSPNLLTPNIKWLKTRQAPPPANLPKEGLIIGKNIFRDESRDIRILDDDRRRHFYVIGQTGTGKSVLLQEMVRQDIEAGKGVCLIDPHGDLAEKVLSLIPASRAEDVVYFNPGDIERPLGLNMLEYDPQFPESKTFVVNELIEIFEKLYNLKALGFGGPIFEQYMRNALLLIMDDPESGSTLVEIPRVLSDVEFRKYKLSKCKNIVVKNFWEKEAEKAGGEAALANMVPYITSKMNVFIANDLVRPIIAQQKSAFNLREIMDNGKILIINLSKGRLGDMNSYLLGMIIVGKILIAAFSRADILEEKRRDFYLYIDEFHNVTTQTITKALAEARKYRLSLTFGHQFIGQLDEETKKAIFGNVGSMLVFRVGPDDAKYLMTSFASVFDEEDLVSIDNYNAALRLLIKGETSQPFNIATYPPSQGNPKVASLIKEYCRSKYGKDRAKVEEELYSRLQKDNPVI
ncbi:MAG: type IV secretory system conjugative DNA transfer family protein [Candidatus Nealsonbacteria bacterium]